ncbi:MAG: L,D-transpeptidase family protein [Planctomycetota bacterium]
MKKRTFFVTLLVVGGVFLVVWRLRANGNAVERPVSPAYGTPQGSSTDTAAGRSEADNLLDRAIKTLQGGDETAARQMLADVAKRFPTQPAGARASIRLASVHEKAGEQYEARNALSRALKGIPEGLERDDVVAKLTRLNAELVFSKKDAPDSIIYTVKSGDALARIARPYDTTAEFIMKINYLTSNKIHPGDRLKLFQGPFDVVIEKSKFRLTVYRSGIFIKEYAIGLGKNGTTPEGEFAVTSKLIDPEWDPPGPEYAASGDPDNPLGTRWIEFTPHYGIHGTIEPETIGKEESRGCIRMLRDEVEQLYDIVVPGSKVTIKP